MRQAPFILLFLASFSVSAQVRPPIFQEGDWRYTVENHPNNSIQQVVVDPRSGKIMSQATQGTDKYIVKFSSSVSGLSKGRSAQDHHAQFERDWNDANARQRASGKATQTETRIRFSYRRAFNGKAITASEDLVNELRRLPYVVSIVEDKVVKTSDATSNAQIGAIQTWSQFGLSGQGVVIGIIDTGIDYGHTDLGAGFGPTHKVIGGYDFVNNDSDPMDDHGHGTHVAGIAAANGTHKGVAPGAKLVAFKVLDQSGYGWDSWILAAIERTLDPDQNPGTNDKLDVVNMSLGRFPDPAEPLSEAVNNAVAEGVVFVVAAGNNGTTASVGTPGIAAGAITVGAVDQNDVVTYFSSRGPAQGYTMKPDLAAPGFNIVSTVPGNTEDTFSGTSMASPHVAGAAALLLEKNPTWTPEVVKAVLMETAEEAMMDAQPATVFEAGTGRIDVLSAAEAKIAITPGSISLGMIDKSSPVMSRSYTLKVMNLSNSSKTYSLALSGALTSAGVTTSVAPGSFTLAAGAVKEVTLSISINTVTLPLLNYPNGYTGYIHATAGSETMKTTVSFMNHMQLTLNLPGELPGSIAIFNTTGWPYKFIFATPAPEVTLDLPADTYEFVANYGNAIVAKSSITLPAVSELTIEKSDAIYRLDFAPRDENGVVLPAGLTGNTSLNVNINWNGLSTMYLGPQPTLYVSAMPPSYVIDFAVNDFKSVGSNRFYSIVGTAVGASEDKVLENSPAQMTRTNYPRHIEPGTSVGITSFFSAGSFTTWTNEPRTGAADFQYWSSRRDKLSKVRMVSHSLETDPRLGYSYQLPSINLYQNDSLSFHGTFVQGELEHRQFNGSALTYMLGHSPLLWAGNTWNSSNEILISSSNYSTSYFRHALGDYQRGTVTYKIKDAGNSVIKEGSVINVLEVDQKDWDNAQNQENSFIRVSELAPGEYKAEFHYRDYHVRGTFGQARAELTMRTDQSDPNPPSIDRLTIIQNNISTDSLTLGQAAELRYTFGDMSGIASKVIKIRNTINGDWINISSSVGSTFSTIPNNLTPGPYKLYIEVADYSGNKMVYEASPAFLVGPVLNSAPFIKPVIIAPTNGATTSVHPGFLWNTITGVTSYRLQVSKMADFSVVDHDVLHDGIAITFPSLFDEFTKFYCRVRIETESGSGLWSDVKSFTTGSGAVYRMTLLEPADGKLDQTDTTTFKWQRNQDQTLFVFQVAKDAAFTQIVAEKTTSDTTQTVVMGEPLHNYHWRVRPLTDFVVWSDPFDFTTRDAIVTLEGPAHQSTGVGHPPSLTWNCVPLPQQLELEVWEGDNMSPVISESLPGTATMFNAEGLKVLSDYRWRIKAIYSGTTKYSDEFTFTTQDAIVEQVLPADDATNQPVDIILEWNINPQPAQTSVEISLSPDFDVLIDPTSVSDSSALVEELSLDTKYYWRVRVDYGYTERVSATRTFTTIIDTRVFLTSPVDAAVDVDLPVAFAWTTVPGITNYRVELSLTADFAQVYKSIDVSGAQVSLSLVRPDTKFYWRASINKPGYPLNWSAISSFTSSGLEVTLISPADNSVNVSPGQTFKWTATPSSTHRLEFATDQAFNSLVTTKVTTTDSTTVTGLEYKTTYFWRVISGFESAIGTSAVRKITVLDPAPRLIAPEMHASNVPTTFVLSWTGVANVSGYFFDISENPAFTSSTLLFTPAPATALAMTGLRPGKTYYWKVGVDLTGKRYWSGIFDFSTTLITGVDDERDLWTVSPNPAKTQVVIALPEGPHQIVVRNSLGQSVWQHAGTSAETTWQWDTHIAAPADGIYAVTLHFGGELKVVKLKIAK